MLNQILLVTFLCLQSVFCDKEIVLKQLNGLKDSEEMAQSITCEGITDETFKIYMMNDITSVAYLAQYEWKVIDGEMSISSKVQPSDADPVEITITDGEFICSVESDITVILTMEGEENEVTVPYLKQFPLQSSQETYQEVLDAAKNNVWQPQADSQEIEIPLTEGQQFSCHINYVEEHEISAYVKSDDVQGCFYVDSIELQLQDLNELGLVEGSNDQTLKLRIENIEQSPHNDLYQYNYTGFNEWYAIVDSTLDAQKFQVGQRFNLIQNVQYTDGSAALRISLMHYEENDDLTTTINEYFYDFYTDKIQEEDSAMKVTISGSTYQIKIEGTIDRDTDDCNNEESDSSIILKFVMIIFITVMILL